MDKRIDTMVSKDAKGSKAGTCRSDNKRSNFVRVGSVKKVTKGCLETPSVRQPKSSTPTKCGSSMPVNFDVSNISVYKEAQNNELCDANLDAIIQKELKHILVLRGLILHRGNSLKKNSELLKKRDSLRERQAQLQNEIKKKQQSNQIISSLLQRSKLAHLQHSYFSTMNSEDLDNCTGIICSVASRVQVKPRLILEGFDKDSISDFLTYLKNVPQPFDNIDASTWIAISKMYPQVTVEITEILNNFQKYELKAKKVNELFKDIIMLLFHKASLEFTAPKP